jgi:hypothetical protein
MIGITRSMPARGRSLRRIGPQERSITEDLARSVVRGRKARPPINFLSLTGLSKRFLERGQLEAESNCEQDVTGLGTYELSMEAY